MAFDNRSVALKTHLGEADLSPCFRYPLVHDAKLRLVDRPWVVRWVTSYASDAAALE